MKRKSLNIFHIMALNDLLMMNIEDYRYLFYKLNPNFEDKYDIVLIYDNVNSVIIHIRSKEDILRLKFKDENLFLDDNSLFIRTIG